MHQDFAKNLRLLCSYYRSIAEVCRRLDINRSQFNRYLNGRYRPSAHTLRGFCEFFGIEEFEILLPHEQFKRLISVKPSQLCGVNEPVESNKPESVHLNKLSKRGASGLTPYLGYYFEYYISMALPGKILRTLICLEERSEGVYYQRTERLRDSRDDSLCHGVYLGLAYFLTDRIFLVDYESLTGHEITETILFPSFKNRITRLHGLKLGVSGSGERMPCCARVVYECLGRSVDVRRALSMCGIYDLDCDEIDGSIVDSVSNSMGENDWHFRARH